MSDENRRLLSIWEDTVDLRELLIGIAGAAALGFASFIVSWRVFTAQLPNDSAALIKGYALMGGILGCVLAAVIIAVVFKPKRVLRESEGGLTDPAELLVSLGLDPDEERRALETASPKVIREMQQLQIYDLFVDFSRKSDGRG